MRKVGILLFVVALFVVPAIAARWVAKEMHWDFKLTYLAALALVSAGLSVFLAVQKLLLRRKLRLLSTEQIEELSATSHDIKFAFPTSGARSSTFTVFVGITAVNLPTLPLLVGPIAILQIWFSLEPPLPQFAALALGFALAWAWWSVGVSKWRVWAERGGMSAAEVQYRGERASILWPHRHFFERTEWANLRAWLK